MFLQNRTVLDIVMAPQDGVCHLLRTSCCTYIPDNDADGDANSKAFDCLKKLSAAQMSDQYNADEGWWSWLSQEWGSWLIKLVTPVIGIIVAVSNLAC